MSKVSKKVKQTVRTEKEKPVVNFMGGVSYQLNPLDTLKMIAASSIFAEPSYYRGEVDAPPKVDDLVKGMSLFDFPEKSVSEVFLDAIRASLDYSFQDTIQLALELRQAYNMRLNPQIIMVLASSHSSRVDFDKSHPGEFRRINALVMSRADEPACQLSCWLYLHNNKKNGIPSVLKRSWGDRISSMNAYQINKYKNAESGLINTVRICHAKGELVGELMKTGSVKVTDEEKTWENLHSAGKTFREIFHSIKLPHMALLRNLRNIMKEIPDTSAESRQYATEVLDKLKQGVLKGKQFPFRYYTAYNILKNEDTPFKNLVLDALEQCIEISLNNMPKLKGKTMCLSDNSGSAWGAIPSEYGSVTIAEIDNLSSVIAAKLSDEGKVGLFGDDLKTLDISKNQGVLEIASKLDHRVENEVGGATENGIWLFFKRAIENKEVYDNIFIFSDQQAGHGGLYGIGYSYLIDGVDFGIKQGHTYVDVMALLREYRKKVNPKVNFLTVQTAGYNNAVIPEYVYRGAVLTGWTGKEVLFASELIRQWDEIERRGNGCC